MNFNSDFPSLPYTSRGGPHDRKPIPVSVAWSNWEYSRYSALDGMLVYRRVPLSSMSLVTIYTPGWRETMSGKVSCLRKQHNGRNWASRHRPSDLKSHALTTTPPHPDMLWKGRLQGRLNWTLSLARPWMFPKWDWKLFFLSKVIAFLGIF